MTEITNPFDPEHDYVDDLTDKEMFEKDGVQCVALRGLQRLAHRNRGGVRGVYSRISHTPARDNPIAAVTVEYSFHDGTTFCGSADATPAAHKRPFSLHLVAVAESKAEARALRRAFNINRVSFEELGSAPIAGPDTDKEKVTDQTLRGIRVVAKRKGIAPTDLTKISGKDVSDISELTQVEGRDLMKKLNAKKVKSKPKTAAK